MSIGQKERITVHLANGEERYVLPTHIRLGEPGKITLALSGNTYDISEDEYDRLDRIEGTQTTD